MFQWNYLIYLGIIALGFVAGVSRNFKKPTIAPIVLLLAITLLSETLSKLLAVTIHNNSYGYHFFHPIQLMLWGVFFYRNSSNPRWKTIIVRLSFLFIICSMLSSFLWQKIQVFPGDIIKFETLLLLLWAFHLFLEFLDKPTGENIFINPVFILTIAVIWFNLISFLFFDFFNFFLTSKIPTSSLRAVHYFSNYVYYLLLFIAMLLKDKNHGIELS